MKDIVITGAKVRRELWWLLAAFILANLMNAYAIAKYDTAWKELFTTLGYVILLSLVLYLLIALVRWIAGGLWRVTGKKRTA